jgi:diguanylate cyclase (GGDEF)-like protein
VTLRGRLTTAFLAVVLGPVLLGAFFVGWAVTAVSGDRALERLDRADASAATSIGALCRQLNAAAGAVAIVPDGPARRAAADRIVTGGLGSAVLIAGPTGHPLLTTAGAPPRPWIDCSGPGATTAEPVAPAGPPAGAPGAGGLGAVAARVDLRDHRGAPLGSVTVASTIDRALVDRLAGAAGAAVTLLGQSPDGGTVGLHSTEPPAVRDAVVRAAAALASGPTAKAGDRYVRRIGPGAAQPLPLVLSVPRRAPQGLYALLAGAVVLTGAFVVAVAWWLARSTTRPLAVLAHAADRVAGGDLAARVPVRGQDEVARLAATFNRMTRETQAYVQALTASRDQLRGHLAILGDTLSSTHDLGRILQVILQTALAATGARAGVVLLLDPTTATLVGQCAEGLDERWPVGPGTEPDGERGGPADGTAAPEVLPDEDPTEEQEPVADHDPATLRVSVGSGLLGTVAATGVPLRGHVDRDGPPLSPYEPRCRTYVAVPFAMPGPVGGDGPATAPAVEPPGPPPVALGVLALYDRLGSDEFDDSDVTTLRTFAGQAAVAVDNVRAHEEAQRLSLTDPLTGLWNYRYLQESVRREVERASRFHRMLTVLALDLDRFKEVNDTYGHAAGDAVLAEFARRVRLALREVDLAFRQGGEEFVVLLPETDRTGGEVVAERLGAIIRTEPVAVRPVDPLPGRVGPLGGTLRIPITVSIGVAVYPDHAATAPHVLEAADDALYAAKAAGRDTYRVAAPGPPTPVRELSVRAAAAPPDDGLPRAGGAGPAATTPPGVPAGGGVSAGGASGGPHPPRQTRGR